MENHILQTTGRLALIAAMLFVSQLMQAQHAPAPSQPSQTQQPAARSANQHGDQATEQNTFTGVIAKSGDKLVLTDPLTRTSYQLDDQGKAEGFVRKNVKVTGVLDPSTGTIRVSAIDPI